MHALEDNAVPFDWHKRKKLWGYDAQRLQQPGFPAKNVAIAAWLQGYSIFGRHDDLFSASQASTFHRESWTPDDTKGDS